MKGVLQRISIIQVVVPRKVRKSYEWSGAVSTSRNITIREASHNPGDNGVRPRPDGNRRRKTTEHYESDDRRAWDNLTDGIE